MNKAMLTLIAVQLAVASLAHNIPNFFGLKEQPSRSRTPNIGGGTHQRSRRPHAPNDGRWHMKYHRSRS